LAGFFLFINHPSSGKKGNESESDDSNQFAKTEQKNDKYYDFYYTEHDTVSFVEHPDFVQFTIT
ncbi:MAG: hypothetical protein PHC92_08525, partial [Syntrophomonadaceae bacterium]|nr:hypothetical protein [Syntrophomonadaceae bacterium]